MTARVLSVSVTEAGKSLAARLPFESVHGEAAATVRSRWPDVDAFVVFLATGAAVRIVAPLLDDKYHDPAVVCVDEAGQFAVSLCGGHAGGANGLARQVAELIGAVPVVTTATDSTGMMALDSMPGLIATGDVAGVTTALLDGRPVSLENERGWPLPAALTDLATTATASGAGEGGRRIVVTDSRGPYQPGLALLHPPSLVAGIGCSTGAPAEEVSALLESVLDGAGLARQSVSTVATLDRKAAEPGITALGLPVMAFEAATLAALDVPSPSEVVRNAVGTPSVAEAAALSAAGPGSELVATKTASAHATVAVARRLRPAGRLSIVGLGPGSAAHRTPAAHHAVREAEIVIGYGPYLDQCADLSRPGQERRPSPIGEEALRAKEALTEAAAGRRVAMVCSGDPGVYAMASLILDMVGDDAIDVEVVPGVTAALAAAARLGAPLGHDHASVSLSDLLTPWGEIERRLRAAAQGDFVLTLYNPRSARRPWQLEAAKAILLERRPPTTPVGVVRQVCRPQEEVELTTLGALDTGGVDMTTVVTVGSSTTRVVGGRMVTPRGYRTGSS